MVSFPRVGSGAPRRNELAIVSKASIVGGDVEMSVDCENVLPNMANDPSLSVAEVSAWSSDRSRNGSANASYLFRATPLGQDSWLVRIAMTAKYIK